MDEEEARNYMSWLEGEIGNFISYHNHKETMAWAATAFYLPAVIIVGFEASTVLSLFWKFLLIIGLIIICFISLMFVNMQFESRWRAANKLEGMRRSMSLLHVSPDQVNDRSILEFEQMTELVNLFPNWIRNQMDTIESRFPHDIPHGLRSAAKNLLRPSKWMDIDPRLRTELPSYALIVIGTLMAIIVLLIRDC